MKFICIKENLRKALALAVRAVGSNTTLPILNNLLIKTENGQIKISSTNLELAIKTWVGGKMEEPGEITVPAKTLNDFIANLTDEQVVMETEGTDLLVKTEKTKATIKGLPAEDFPLIPEIEASFKLEIDGAELGFALNQVVFAGAFSETQPELSGVLFHFTGNTLRLAATDRYRLAEKTVKLAKSVEERRVIVPSRAVSELIRTLTESKNKAELTLSENQISFNTDQAEIISRLIDGQYPDYQQIIPQKFETEISLDSEALASSLKLSGLFAQENSNVEVEISQKKQSLTLRSTSQRAGSNVTEVEGATTGEDNKIIFNYHYILDCLNHLKQKKIVLKVINSGAPAMIVPQGEESYLYLVMPVKT